MSKTLKSFKAIAVSRKFNDSVLSRKIDWKAENYWKENWKMGKSKKVCVELSI